MKPTVLTAIVLVAATPAVSASKDGWQPLAQTRYRIGSESIIDAPPDEKKDRVYLAIDGEAARSIYEAMPGKAVIDVCEATQMTKSAGGLQCWKPQRGSTFCSVAITLDSGQTAAGSVC